MITGGGRQDPYLQAVARNLNEKFKLMYIEYENYSDWSKTIFAGMVQKLFTKWYFSDPFVSHVYKEWEKALDPYGINLVSSGGNHTYMYFEQYFEVDERKFKKVYKIRGISYERPYPYGETPYEWSVDFDLVLFDEFGKQVKYTSRHRVIPEKWAHALTNGLRVYYGRKGAFFFHPRAEDDTPKVREDLKKCYGNINELKQEIWELKKNR
jgi:hypothetical protein